MKDKNIKLTKSSAEELCQDPEVVRLNLGCGHKMVEGYINVDSVDRFNPDFVHDLSKPLPFPVKSVLEIMAMDIFEHFDKYMRYVVMENWANILVMGGKIILQVPNIAQILTLANKVNIEIVLELIYGENMIASDTYSSHYGNHKWGYTEKSLIEFGKIFGIEFSILESRYNIRAEGVKVDDTNIVDANIYIPSFGNDSGVGKATMSLKETKEKIQEYMDQKQ